MEEFFKSAVADDLEVGAVGNLSLQNGVFVNVTLNLLNEFNLTALVIKGNDVVVCGAKEVLENFKCISTETVS